MSSWPSCSSRTRQACGCTLMLPDMELVASPFAALSENLDLFTQLTECQSEHAGGSHVSRRPARCANVNAWHVNLSTNTSSQAIARLLAVPSSSQSPANAAPPPIQSPADAASLATDAAQPVPSLACLSARLLAHPPSHNSPAVTPATDTAEPILSLECLPATAIAAVFQHLDCPSALNLALTCHAYAAEFVQQKNRFVDVCVTELAPVLSLDVATECGRRLTRWSQPYGSEMNPVSVHVWWESGRALRRIYALHQQQPGFLQSMWRKAWPKNLWQELCANGLPEYQHLSPGFTMHVPILIESKEALTLPWQWLYGPFMRTLYDAVDEVLGQKPGTAVAVSVHRPAAVGRFQEMMLTHFVNGEDDQWEWEFETLSRQSHYYYPIDEDADIFPGEQQLVAVTGDWCSDRLPSADHPLWRAQQGCTLHPTSVCIEDCLYELAARNHPGSGSSDHSRSSVDAESCDAADCSDESR